MPKAKTEPIPFEEQAGVSTLSIPQIEKAINKYEKKKEARCQMSPGEVSAKQDLLAELQAHREKLPVTEAGARFYRYEGVDYFLEESLKRKKADDGADDSD